MDDNGDGFGSFDIDGLSSFDLDGDGDFDEFDYEMWRDIEAGSQSSVAEDDDLKENEILGYKGESAGSGNSGSGYKGESAGSSNSGSGYGAASTAKKPACEGAGRSVNYSPLVFFLGLLLVIVGGFFGLVFPPFAVIAYFGMKLIHESGM